MKIIALFDADTEEQLAACDATGMCNASDYERCIKACYEHMQMNPLSPAYVTKIAQTLKQDDIAYINNYRFNVLSFENLLKA